MIATSTAPSAQRPTVHTVLGLPFPRTSCSGALAGAGGRGFVFTAARSSQRCSRIFTCAALTGAEEAACLAITSRASGYHLGPLPFCLCQILPRFPPWGYCFAFSMSFPCPGGKKVLEARSLRSRCGQATLPLNAQGRTLLASSNFWRLLAILTVPQLTDRVLQSLPSLPPLSHGHLLVCLPSLLIRTPAFQTR
jgi:hypothetical protein